MEEKYYVVRLVQTGINKIALLKDVRELSCFGLNEAKYIVETPNSIVSCEVNYDNALHVKNILEKNEGTVVEIEETYEKPIITIHQRQVPNKKTSILPFVVLVVIIFLIILVTYVGS